MFFKGTVEHAATAIFDGLNGTKPATRRFHFSVFLLCLLFGLFYSSILNALYFFLLFEALLMSLIYYSFKAYAEYEQVAFKIVYLRWLCNSARHSKSEYHVWELNCYNAD